MKQNNPPPLPQQPLRSQAPKHHRHHPAIYAHRTAHLPALADLFYPILYLRHKIARVRTFLGFDRQAVADRGPLLERFHVPRCVLKFHVDLADVDWSRIDWRLKRVEYCDSIKVRLPGMKPQWDGMQWRQLNRFLLQNIFLSILDTRKEFM